MNTRMRNRIPPPILTVVSVFLISFAHGYVPMGVPKLLIFRLVGGSIGFLGITILVWAGVLFKAKKTTVNPFRPKSTSSIVANGPYRITRNPMYLGMLFVIIGTGCWWPHWLAIPIVITFFAYMTAAQIKPEEEALTNKFGAEYTAYIQSVRRWM